MSQPTIYQVHQNVPLTNLSIAFFQSQAAYGLLGIFPRVPSDKQSNSYYTYDRQYWLRSEAKRRAAGTPAARGGYGIGTSTFTVLRDAIGKAVSDPERANADSQIDMDGDATRWINQQLMIKMEERFATAFFGTSIWGTTATPSILWDDASSDPVGDVKTAKRTIVSQHGPDYEPNVLAMGAKLYDKVSEHPDIIDRIKYTGGPGNPAQVNERTLAALFGVQRIVVLRAVHNTASVEGATASYDFIADPESALLCYANPSPGLFAPSAGYTFMWTAAPDGSSFGPAIKQYREEREESDVFEGNVWYQPAVIASSLGYFWSNACA